MDDENDELFDQLCEVLAPLAAHYVDLQKFQDAEARKRAIDDLITIAALEAITPSGTHSPDQNAASLSLSGACNAELEARNGGEPLEDEDGREMCDELEDSMFAAIKLIRSACEPRK